MARKLKEAPEQTALTEQLLDSNTAINIEPAVVEASPYSRCGGVIRIAREKQGLSVQEIASRLRLSPKQIEAIEADNFAALPEPTIVRGFIRNYAKQLKIDAKPLLDAYMVIVPAAMPYEMAVKPTNGMRMSSQEKSKSGRYALAALALLLGLGVWLFYQHYVAKPSPIQPSTNASSTGENTTSAPVEAVLPEVALPAAERAAEQAATDTQTSTELTLPAAGLSASLPLNPVTNQATPAVTVSPAPSVSLPAAPLPITQSNTQLPSSQLTASTTLSSSLNSASADALALLPATAPKGLAKLEFNATQETWVNVTDVNGREIYSKIIFAGSRETIEAKSPFNVVVGNASGTTLAVNGKPMDLAPHTRVNVAHIKVE